MGSTRVEVDEGRVDHDAQGELEEDFVEETHTEVDHPGLLDDAAREGSGGISSFVLRADISAQQ